MEFLIACDLEGINGVVGEPYKGLLRELPDYQVAIRNAEKEINAAARALFDSGATKVALWENHGGGHNIDVNNIDSRVVHLYHTPGKERFRFCHDHNFCGIIYLGYHAREGTLNAVLAHTYSSVAIQYVKLDGVPVGELDIDTYICTTHGIAPLFAASDDKCIAQFKELAPEAVTVITKYAKGRNEADLIPSGEVEAAIYDGVCKAAKLKAEPIAYSTPAFVEIRYTRMEDAAKNFNMANERGIPVKYGEDAHILELTVENISDIPFFL